MKKHRFNQKMAQSDRSGGWKLRVWYRKGKGKICDRYLIKCGCCDNHVEIYYDDESLEINGVNANVNEWRNILLPLLGSKE